MMVTFQGREATSDLSSAHMRLRDQTIQKDKETWRPSSGRGKLDKDSYVRFDDILKHAIDTNTVLMVDPKVPGLQDYFPMALQKKH
ncbi:hypothetical protein RS130_22095 [Paraglaciecola aquimarina]|uniref:Uncharacterized protein n=1 Tax=Paraglaciecola aquimarina TaxID=1235557 RepID=A0ABU3T1R2_9ALTE|nr:hypothetical protein [Paraglaciecola aquimarina]MDU0356214.1 hypothetical protein [Paraglaciecola aquimarina]